MTLVLAAQARAIVVLDTGPGPSQLGGATLSAEQWLGVKFTLTAPTTITSIQGWMGNQLDTVVSFDIFADAGVTPKSVLLPQSVLFQTSLALAPNLSGWQGPTGLNWNLGPGSYWAVFASSSTTDGGYYAYMPTPIANPSPTAYTHDQSLTWFATSPPVGARINGVQSVPDTGDSLWLFAVSLAALPLLRSKRRILRSATTPAGR